MLTDQLLLDYKRCQRRGYLNINGDFHQRDRERDFLLKLRQESHLHIQRVINRYYPNYVKLPPFKSAKMTIADWQRLGQETVSLMQQGVECIYGGVLFSSDYSFPLVGIPHLLVKQPGESNLGDWEYMPISIQLGRRPKPEYKLIATFYAYLLGDLQGTIPSSAKIILRQQNYYTVDLKVWLTNLQETLAQFSAMVASNLEPEVFISRQRCTLCHWYNHCYNIAQTAKHLSLVPGVTPIRYQYLQALGINTVESLAQISTEQVSETMGKEVAMQLKQQALSIVENRPLVKNSHFLPSEAIELYFDIEAEPDRQLDYLLGVLLVDRPSNTETFYPLLAEYPEEEELVWNQFLDLVNLYPHSPIFHYSEYEVETIKRLAKLYHTPKEQQESLLSRLIDLHQYVTKSVIFPVESYSLKSLANWLGFQWRHPGVSGDQSVYWYDQWLKSQDRRLLDLILRYNEDDCRATKHLKDWLVEFLN